MAASNITDLKASGFFFLDFYHEAMRNGDPRTSKWPLMESPIPTLATVSAYFLLVWAGPKFMENRKPIKVGHLLTAYNFLLVGLSAYMTYEFVMSAYLANYSLGCQPVDYSNSPLALRMASVCWVYFFSKFIEVADTVFFILRKKSEQLTFLHVFHHGTMISNWWMAVKYVPGGVTFFHAALNSFVHVIMYSYYGLSALGPAVQPYLWWKRYVTWIQQIQFGVVLIHSLNVVFRCNFNLFFSLLSASYAVIMIVLFSNYYYQQFIRKMKAKKRLRNKASKVANGTEAMRIATNNNHKQNGSGEFGSNGFKKMELDNQTRKRITTSGSD